MTNFNNTLTVKATALDLCGYGNEYAIETIATDEDRDYTEVQAEYNTIPQTYKKVGRGSTTTFTIRNLRDVLFIETHLGGNLGFQESQNMFGEERADRKMEEYLNDKLAELRIIEDRIKEEEE